MFLRKLAVIVLPLLGLWALLSLAGPLQGLGIWGEAGFGILGGLGLSLIPLIAGETRGRIPFSRQLWIPAGLLLGLLVLQGLAVRGDVSWLPRGLAAPGTQTYLLEGIACGALAGRAIRG